MNQNFKIGDKVVILPLEKVNPFPCDDLINDPHGLHSMHKGKELTIVSKGAVDCWYLDGEGATSKQRHFAYHESRFAAAPEAVEAIAPVPVVPMSNHTVIGIMDLGPLVGVARTERRAARAYDFARGDIRRYNYIAALKAAIEKVKRTGREHTLRLDGPAIHGGRPLYLVQEA